MHALCQIRAKAPNQLLRSNIRGSSGMIEGSALSRYETKLTIIRSLDVNTGSLLQAGQNARS
jgi:hypothetical protein